MRVEFSIKTLYNQFVTSNSNLYVKSRFFGLLLDLDQPAKGDEIEKVWDQEIRARVKAVDESRVSGVPYDILRRPGSSGVSVWATHLSDDHSLAREVPVET